MGKLSTVRPAPGRAAALAGALALFVLAACATAPKGPVRSGGEAAAAPDPVAGESRATTKDSKSRPAAAATEITVAAVGDIMLGTDFPEDRLPPQGGGYLLAEVAPILRGADIAFGNLEGVLMDGGQPRKSCSNPNACFLFRSPARYAGHLADAGFDVLSLANNHARDFGEEGRSASMRALARAGIAHTGREGDFAVLSVKGLDVAVLGFAVTQKSNLLHDYEAAAATVAAFAERHDVVIVSFHGGAEGRDAMRLPFAEEEYYGEPRGDVVRFARRAVDSGADLVLGHGPHVPRAMEVYRERLIAYSLGNFATWYGISIDGPAGIAPILQVTLDGSGRFVEGQVYSTRQKRPRGTVVDNDGAALELLRELSLLDFGSPGIRFLDNGRILPDVRTAFREHRLETPTPEDGGEDTASCGAC